MPEEGIASRLTERVGWEATLTVTLSEVEPPGPLQVRVKVVELVRLPVLVEPEVGLAPDQPPEALQLLALAVFHDRVALLLWGMVIGPCELLTFKSTVGFGSGSVTPMTIVSCAAVAVSLST